MSKTAFSINVSGWFFMIGGAILIFLPSQVMMFFWKDLVFDFWLRTLGYFMAVEGYLCYKASFKEWMDFYKWILNIRLFQSIFFLSIVINDYANPGLLFYSTFELFFGIWAFFAYKRET